MRGTQDYPSQVFAVSLMSGVDILHGTTTDTPDDLMLTLSSFSPGLLEPMRYAHVGQGLCFSGKGLRTFRLGGSWPLFYPPDGREFRSWTRHRGRVDN